MTSGPSSKPILRGYLHQEAFYLVLGACLMLVAKGTTRLTLISALIFSMGLLCMLGISALYHRKNWSPGPRLLLKRMDHAAIFVLIACTATPIALLALAEPTGTKFLIIMWSSATVGVVQSIFWVRAPKWLTAIFYLAMGWAAVPYLSEIASAMGTEMTTLLVLGGVAYTAGALCYAMKWPKLAPQVFGYHELFHLFTLVGAGLHFVVIYQLIR